MFSRTLICVYRAFPFKEYVGASINLVQNPCQLQVNNAEKLFHMIHIYTECNTLAY